MQGLSLVLGRTTGRRRKLRRRCFRGSHPTAQCAFTVSVAALLLLYVGLVTDLFPRRIVLDMSAAVAQKIARVPPEPKAAPSVPEVRRIVYVRIPKTGSSTVTLLVWRFAWTRNLTVLAVNPKFEGTRAELTKRMFFLPPPGRKYDVMAEHVLYDKWSYDRYFANDTVYTTLLREPFSLLYSTLYYVPEYKRDIPGKDKVKVFLENPGKYTRTGIMAGRSYSKNPQTSFLGLKKWDFHNDDRIQELISSIDRDFPVVMILEKLDESLVLLRRELKWPMKDIIYAVQNVNSKKPKLNITQEQRQQYREWSFADHKLYDFFLAKLEKAIQNGGRQFREEVELYRKYRVVASKYCRFRAMTDEDLWFPQTAYNERFSVTRRDCALINVEPLVLISNIRKRQGTFPYLSPSL